MPAAPAGNPLVKPRGLPRTAQIHLADVSHGYADRLLLDHIDLSVAPGEHVAIIGENGAGKSTLLRLIAGMERPDGGTVAVGARTGLLPQSIGSNGLPTGAGGPVGGPVGAPVGATVGSAIDDSLSGLRELERRLRVLEAAMADATAAELEEYGRLRTEFELRGGYQADARVDSALNHLGLGAIGRDRALASLSGGEQERVALACLLADPPPILLLDEPTNHLDDVAVDWLERQLASHPGTVVVVSHDRTFLARVATAVLEVDADRRQLRRYGNGFVGYLGEKAAERRRWEQRYRRWLDAMDAERQQADTVAGTMGYARRRDGDKMAFD